MAGLLTLLMAQFRELLTGPSANLNWSNWISGAVIGILIGLPLGVRRDLLGGIGKDENSFPAPAENRHKGPVAGLVVALAFGLAFGVVFARQSHSGMTVGILVLLLVGFLPRLAGGLVTELAQDKGSPQGPLESWRNDRVFGLVAGLTFGLAAGIGSGLAFGPLHGLRFDLADALAFGLTVGLMYGIASPMTWSTALAWRVQLRCSRRVPVVGLMSFLEDARQRGVLRTVGAIYQFRHATLQDQLARQTSARPATASVAQLSSQTR